MVHVRQGVTRLVSLMVLLASALLAQDSQNIPDAPKPKVPESNQFPGDAPPAPKNPRSEDHPAAATTPTPQALPPNQGGVTTDRSQLPGFVISVNFVVIPVTVKDSAGHLFPGLGPNDFTVYEDGVPQKLKFFSSDATPLTAAVIVASDLPATTAKKVNDSLPALIGAFSEYDEVALYRYGHTVTQVASYSGASSISSSTLARLKQSGRSGGPPEIFGPMAQGPSINGHEAAPGSPGSMSGIPAPVSESFVLNDAILRAAQDLSKRDRSRRKIIFVVSDGRELGSVASFDEVRKVLLSNNISVFGVGVDTAAIPVYDKLGRIRVPGFGTSNILPRYADATGGTLSAEFDRQSIEQAFAKITDGARNDYTLGYNAPATVATAFRTIEVIVHRPGLTVYAKQGYYPLPPASPQRH
ncbi:MAG TPA: VWA domain-containing protein [Terriglobales bacterium]